MSNLKDELQHLDIPSKELRARAQKGIQQVAKERSKKRRLLIGGLTATVTAAAVLFIVAILDPNVSQQSASGAETAALWYSKWLVIPLLSALLVGLLYYALKLVKRYPKQKGWTIFGALVGVYCVGVGIWYSANMLQERIVLPIAYDFVKSDDGTSILLKYVVDRFDEKTDIEALIVDGHKIELDPELEQHRKKEVSNQIYKRSLNYTLKLAYVKATPAQMDVIILGEANLQNSYVQFFDGTTVPISIAFFRYMKDLDGQYVSAKDLQPAFSGGSGSYKQTDFILNGETRIEAVQFPKQPYIEESYEVILGERVIKRVNKEGEADLDLLPVEVTDERVLTVRIYNRNEHDELLQFNMSMLVFGEQKIYEASIYRYEIDRFNGILFEDF